MKILLLGDYSACQLTLGQALTRMGHSVTLASDGCKWMHTVRDYDLRRRLPGTAGGALLYLGLRWLRPLRGFDVVSLISPTFATLRPERLKSIFDRLRRDNGAVFLTAAGTDKAMMDYYLSDNCRLAYTEYRNSDGSCNERNTANLLADMQWQKGTLGSYCDYVYDHIDGVCTTLYEYHLAMAARFPAEKVCYTGLPVELPPRPGNLYNAEHPVKFMLGRDRHRMAWKGTDRIEAALTAALADNPGCGELDIVENLPYAEYLERLWQSDVLIDQLYSYTPALNALLAMARGKAVVSGGEEDFYRFIGENDLRPVINVKPDDDELYATFVNLLRNRKDIEHCAAESYDFVKRHNSADAVARRTLDFWIERCR